MAGEAHAQQQSQKQSQTSGGKPNILVIFGDDIGQSNVSAYSMGLMGYRTPNIDRIAKERHDLHRLLRRAELHGGPLDVHHRPVRRLRTGLSKVGIPGAPVGLQARDMTIAQAAQAARLRDGPVRQEPPRRPERVSADGARLRRVLRQPLPPQRRGRAGAVEPIRGTPSSGRCSARAACCAARRPTWTTRPSSRAGAGSASRRSRTPGRSPGSAWRRSTTRPRPPPSISWSGRSRPASPSSAG